MIAASDAAAWTGVSVAVTVFLFSVGSFWWLHWHRGRLRVAEPWSYAAYANAGKVILRLPLVMLNTGAAPIVVQNLRLTFIDVPGRPVLDFAATGKGISPSDDEPSPGGTRHTLRVNFPIKGRDAVTLIAVFIWNGEFDVRSRCCRMKLEVVYMHKKGWHDLLEFDLCISEKSAPTWRTNYIAHDNSLEP